VISVILACAGKGIRLYSESLELPKPLLFYKSKPIIAHLIDIYRQISNDIIVVISNDRFGTILKSWLQDYYETPPWLRFVVQPQPAGTNDAVGRALGIVIHKHILVSWGDIIPNSEDFLNSFSGQRSVFYTADIDCRFGIKNNTIVQEQSRPGFLGIYYLTEKPNINPSKEDFIENFIGQEITTKQIDVISIGNLSEFIQNKPYKKTPTRYFNKLEFTESVVIKTPLTSAAEDLQSKEINWYNNSSKVLKSYLPKYNIENNKLILERINGKNLSEVKLTSEFWRIKLPALLISLHQKKVSVDPASCIDTYILKPNQRFDKVKNTIKAWFGDKIIINGKDYTKWSFPNTPADLIPKNFTFIHGDLQFSNMRMDTNNNLKVIDPRGYFGHTLLYGDPAYDIAKLLYAIDGYHRVNEGKFAVHNTKNGTILIHQSDYISDDIKWFFSWAQETYKISKEKLDFLVFGIWLSLTSYIINDPLAIIASFCKAMIRSKEGVLAN
jgi:thiamine kinase-like enzyme/UTP-glucose-1-phosphate uridylyltransferase